MSTMKRMPMPTATMPRNVIIPRPAPGTTPAPIMNRPNASSPMPVHVVWFHSGPVTCTFMLLASMPVRAMAAPPTTVKKIPIAKAISWAGLNGGRSNGGNRLTACHYYAAAKPNPGRVSERHVQRERQQHCSPALPMAI